MIQGLDCKGVTECLFTPVNIQTDRTEASGDSLVLTTGHPRWNASLRVETPNRQSKAVWRSFVTSRAGAKNPFLISRSFSLRPRGGPISDVGMTVAAYDAEASTVSLAGAGVWASKFGDMLSYYTAAGGYWIGEIQGNISAVGGAITVPVWPFPVAPHATLARPRRNYAFGEFYLTGRLGRSESATPDFLEFEARQLIRRAGGQASPFAPPVQDTNFAITETIIL